MNKTLPIELINLIFSYMSSPVNEIFKKHIKRMNIKINKYIKKYAHDESKDYLKNESFACWVCHFLRGSNYNIYDYSYMNKTYVDNLNDYYKEERILHFSKIDNDF